MSVKRESTVYRFVSERKTQVVIEQTRFLNTVFLYSEFNASPGLLQATAGHLPSLSVPEVGHLQILSCPGAEGQAFANPELLTRTRFRYQNITTQRILLEKHADWLTSQRQEKIEEVCKGMFSILCMHFFMHCLLSQNYIAKSGAIDVNQRVFGY